MKLLRVIATVDPRHGGPAAGLRAITPELTRLGHETTVVSLDTPERIAELRFPAILHALGPARGGYAHSPRLEPWLRANASNYDAVFVHGLWQHHGRAVRSALQGMATPYFVFPHGMLDPWFRRAYPLKHVKKWIYWQLCERHVLRNAAAVLFTCDEERRLARLSFQPYQCTERVVAYGTAAPEPDAEAQRAAWRRLVPELRDRPYWLFLGRIHPKKGADLLMEAYGKLATSASGSLPAVVLAGPCTDQAYRAQLEKLVERLPGRCQVIWPGMLEGPAKWGALRAAEAFVLPSHQENFGIAVAESLAVGTPVLISHKVNIWAEIESEGAGFAESDDLPGTLRLLLQWTAVPAMQREDMRRAADKLFHQRYEIGQVARSLIQTISPFSKSSSPYNPYDVVSPVHPAHRIG